MSWDFLLTLVIGVGVSIITIIIISRKDDEE